MTERERRLRELAEADQDSRHPPRMSWSDLMGMLGAAAAIGAELEREACAALAETAMTCNAHIKEGNRYCNDYGCYDGRYLANAIRSRGIK